jgi:hypothetical protein
MSDFSHWGSPRERDWTLPGRESYTAPQRFEPLLPDKTDDQVVFCLDATLLI